MPVKVECPHCHRMLAVPSKFLGATTNCPQCQGVFRMPAQVPPQAMTDSSEEAPITEPITQGGPAQSPTASKPAGSRPMQQSGSSPTARRQGEAAPSAGNSSWMTNQVARFITADSAESRIQPEKDGSLPQLSLEELSSSKHGQRKDSSSNPVVLVIALCCSIGASLVMLLVDAGPSKSRRQQIADSRKEIEAKFFHDPQPCPSSSCRSDPRYMSGGKGYNWSCDVCGQKWQVDPSEKPEPPKEYQVLLRRAQQAFSRGDRESERRNYRQVLKLLHAEERSQFVGLTDPRGTVRDKLLERLIAEILRE